MPIVSEFFGIKIYMYWAEHFPAHFHAQYGNEDVLVNINDAVVIKGSLPSKQLKLVLAWCEIHKDELLKNWESSIKNGEIAKISPLR